MANDARTQFIDGLRVTADHLQHLQDRLREAVRDLRLTVGVRRIAWGLRVATTADSVSVSPGVAFAANGIRLSIDTDVNLALPPGSGPWQVTLRAVEQDRTSLRVGDKPTLIQLITSVAIEPADAPDAGADALVIGALSASDGGLTATQDPSLFAVAGHHAHSGEFLQDADGRWYYDGPNVEGEQGPVGPTGEQGPAGPTGAQGPAGPTGAQGPAGPTGAQGPAGPTGEQGPAGPTGEQGSSGERGAAGVTGAPGALGATGARGDKGDRGDPGPSGPMGPMGPIGPVGPPGPGLDLLAPTIITRVSWPIGEVVQNGLAFEVLQQPLRFDLSQGLDDQTLKQQPQVVQVWFLPTEASLMHVVHGEGKLDREGITWHTTDSPAQLRELIGQSGGGQVLIRVHCGHLFDQQGRPVSATLDAVTPFPNPFPVYGGVFEAWFFATKG